MGEPSEGSTSVLPLRPALHGGHRYTAVMEPTPQSPEGTRPERVGDARAANHVEGHLHPGVGGVDALPTGPTRPTEAPLELMRGDDDTGLHHEVVVHVISVVHRWAGAGPGADEIGR